MPRRAAKDTSSDIVRVTVRVPREKAARLRAIAAEMRGVDTVSLLDRLTTIDWDDESWAIFQEALERSKEPHSSDAEQTNAFLRNLEDLEPHEIGFLTLGKTK